MLCMRQMTPIQSRAPGLVFSTWILSIYSMFYWICLLFTLLVLVGVELALRLVVTLSQNAVTSFLESS